ncbi:MAG: PAS domain S-box protein, partial [Chloroflexota bacterium]|nr:PAS domain S-box protein [Chloroflexota bacterium]
MRDSGGQLVGILGVTRDITERVQAEQTLQESEKRFRDLFENSPDAIFVQDFDGNVIDVNPAACCLHGIEREILIEKNALKLVPPDEREEAAHNILKLAEGELYHIEGHSWTEDGCAVPVEIRGRRIDHSGKPAILLHVRDVTERMQADAALRRLSKDREEVFQALGNATMIIDPEFNIIDANRFTVAATGKSKDELLGKKCYKIMHGTGRPPAGCPAEQMITSEHYVPIEGEMQALGGTFIVSCTPVRNDAGRLVNIIHSVTNITERVRAQEKLRESEAQYRGLFERVPVGLYRSTPEGQILDANPVMVQMLGYPDKETLLAVNAVDLFVEPDDRGEEMASLGDKEIMRNFEMQLRRRDGDVVWVRDTFRVLRDAQGQIHSLEGSLEDITERVRSEEMLRTLNVAATAVQRADSTPEAVFAAVMEQLHDVGLAGAVALLDETRQGFTIRYTATTSQTLAQAEKLLGYEAVGYSLPVEQLPISGNILAGESVFIPDTAALIAPTLPAPVRPMMPKVMRLLEMPRGVVAPLSVEEEIIGFLGVSADRMTEADMPVVTAFANQMAAALENAYLFQAEQRGRQVAEALQEVGRVVNASLDLDNVLPLILEQLAQVIQYDSSAVLLFNDDRLEIRAGWGFPDIEAALQLSFAADEDNLPSAVIRARRPLVIGDIQSDPRWQPDSQVTHIRGWIGVPLIVQDRVVGVLTVDSRRPEAYSQEDGQLVFAFADQAAVAIQNAQLYEQAQREIAERVRTERELEERRVYLEGVLGATPNAIVTLDENHLIVYWNPGAERLFGYSPEEVTGKNIDHLITNPDTYEDATGFTQIILGGKKIFPTETVRYRKDGSHVDVIAAGSPILVGDELIGVVAIYIDITERVRAEHALQESEGQLQTLIDAMPDFVCFKDGNGRWLKANDASIRIFQLEGIDYQGKKDSELAELNSHIQGTFLTCKKTDARAWKEGVLFRGEETVPHPDGSVRVYDVIKVPVFHPCGERKGLVVLGHDITERVRAQKKLRRRHRELALLNRVIAAASTTLEPKAVLETTCRELALAFDVPQVAAALLNEERTASTVVAEYLAAGRPSALDVVIPVEGNPATQYVLDHNVPLAVADVQHDPRMSAVHDVMRQRGTVSMLILPLMARGQVVGTLGLDTVERREFSDEEIDLAASAVAAAAQALENARLFSQAQRRLKRMEALHTIDRVISASVDISMTISMFLNQTLTQLEIDAADVLLFDPIMHTLECIGRKGFRNSSLEHTHLRLGQGLAGQVALQREIKYIPDLQAEAEVFLASPDLSGEDFVSYYGVPLMAKGVLNGVLEI